MSLELAGHPITYSNFASLRIVNLEGDISRFPGHPKQPYVQSLLRLTNDGTLGTVGDIEAYWGAHMQEIESPRGAPFSELSWMYVYCIRFRFLKNLDPTAINIAAGDPHKPDPSRAMQRLLAYEEMSDEEVETFLRRAPVFVNSSGIVVDGLHRVCAMIGRLVSGKSYVPLRNQPGADWPYWSRGDRPGSVPGVSARSYYRKSGGRGD